MKEQKICFGFLGNGVTAWTECGIEKSKPDYEAHISPERKITYYQENTPKYFREAIEKKAEDNYSYNGFCVLNPKNKPTKYYDSRFYGRLLICEEFFEGENHLVLKSGQIVDSWSDIKDIDENDNRKVFFVGNLKRDDRGEMHGEKFGFTFSLENAVEAVNAIRNWVSPYWRNAIFMEGTISDLVRCGNRHLVNLDWEE